MSHDDVSIDQLNTFIEQAKDQVQSVNREIDTTLGKLKSEGEGALHAHVMELGSAVQSLAAAVEGHQAVLSVLLRRASD